VIEIYVDGLAEPTNPGIGTYGFAIYKDGVKIRKGCGFAGEPVTNNFAEYMGLVTALEEALSFTNEEIIVKSDSKLLVNQMNGRWKIKKGLYIKKFMEAREIVQKFQSIRFLWIPREKNAEADGLSRVAYLEIVGNREKIRRG
jgi:ribonuclease HI